MSLLDLPEAPGLDLVDEAADRILVRDERAGLDPGDGLAYVGVQVTEGLKRERRPDPGVGLDLGLDVVVVESEHAAVGVVDEDDLVRPEQPLGDGDGPDDVVGHDPAGVADHMRVALGEPEHAVGVEPGVHAGDHRGVRCGRQRQVPLVEAGRVLPGVGDEGVGATHGSSPGEMVGYRRDRIRSRASLILTCRIGNIGLTSGFTGARFLPRDGAPHAQLLSSRRNMISFSSSRMAAATGIATSAPTMPSRTPPIRTATRLTIAGTCTVRPMIRGTIR